MYTDITGINSWRSDHAIIQEHITKEMYKEPVIAENFVVKDNYYSSLTWIPDVFNPVNIYCNHFHYPAAEASSDLVWDEIEKASHAVWSDIIGEEPLS